MNNKKLFSATIFFKANRIRPRKYRNISHQVNFTKFAKKLFLQKIILIIEKKNCEKIFFAKKKRTIRNGLRKDLENMRKV
jgi:hypothetical protein